MNLSDKIILAKKMRTFLDKDDVKAAVKELKDAFRANITVISKRKFLDKIDEIFGEKLI